MINLVNLRKRFCPNICPNICPKTKESNTVYLVIRQYYGVSIENSFDFLRKGIIFRDLIAYTICGSVLALFLRSVKYSFSSERKYVTLP
jgi:hypothetical protein